MNRPTWLRRHTPKRPRCSACGRRVSRNGHATATEDEAVYAYCNHRAACRRAQHERHGQPLLLSGASDESPGAALIAADYVRWPWWLRVLITRGARDQLRGEFARRLAAAVEGSLERRAQEEGRRA